jgi:DNA primase
MANHIPQSFIDELLSRTDIVQVIDQYVPLRKSGSNCSALCPFHTEKNPSFSVSATKQFYYCFGCSASGNAIGFLMNYSHLTFVEAIETLAAQAGLRIPYEAGNQEHKNTLDPAYQVMEKVTQFYEKQLPQAERANLYLKEKRSLSQKIIQHFRIGYAPAGWSTLINAIGKENLEPLITAGMLSQKNTDYYDRFRDRIMFPIRDKRGRIVGFGGRIINDNDTPKYLNSPETPIFHKSQELYGLFEALQKHQKLKQLVVVEGYMDVVALAQHEIDYAVATLGTSITAQHIQRLFQTCNHIIFCFDGDNAGRQAAWRALEVILPVLREEWQIGFMFLPEKEDPDSLIRKESKALFETRITRAHSLSAFFLRYLSHQADMSKLDGRARFAKLAMGYIQKIPSPIIQSMLIEAVAKTASIDMQTLQNMIKDAPVETTTARKSDTLSQGLISPLRKALQLLIQHPELAAHCSTDYFNHTSTEPGWALLVKLLKLLQENPKLSTGGILEHWRSEPEEVNILAKLASSGHLVPEKGLVAEFQDILAHLQSFPKEAQINTLLGKLRQQSITDSEKAELQQLLKENTLKV